MKLFCFFVPFLFITVAGRIQARCADTSVSWLDTSANPCPGMEFKQFFHENGKVSAEGCWFDGKPEGEWKNYDERGNLVSKGARENLKLTGTWTFYRDGKKISEISYQNDKKNGSSKDFLPDREITSFYVNDTLQGFRIIRDTNGNTLQSTPFRNGLENGLERRYNLLGDNILFTFFRDGMIVFRQRANARDEKGLKQGIWKDFYDNGILHWECGYIDGKKNGYCKIYDSLGNLVSLQKYIDGILQENAPELAELTIHTEYFLNGKPKFRVALKDGKPEGVCRQYDSLSGKVVRGILFKDGEIVGTGTVDEHGNLDSQWEEYYPDGSLKCTGRYYKGKKYGQWKYFYPDGKLEQEGRYRNGEYDGRWIWYFPDGRIRLDQEYYMGRLEGNSIEYNDSAQVVAKGKYVDGREEGHWVYLQGGELSEGNYVSGEKDGLWKSYWSSKGKDKRLSFQGRFTGGLPDGRHQYFNENGKLAEEGYYRQGKRIGTWIKYDADGLPELRIRYDNREEETRYNGKRTLTKEEEENYEKEQEDFL